MASLTFTITAVKPTPPNRNAAIPFHNLRRFPTRISCHQKPPTSTAAAQLPPGPAKLPLIGNLHNMIGSGLPHEALQKLAREYGPIIHLQLGELSTAVVSSPKMAQEILKTHDLVFADRPKILASEIISWDCPNIAFSPHGDDPNRIRTVAKPNGDYWKQMKRISLTELLGPRKVQSLRGIREEEVSKFVDSVRRSSSIGETVNITEMAMNLTNSIICKAAFGYECSDQDEFIELTKGAVSAAAGFTIVDLYPSLEFLQGITGMKTRFLKIRDELDRIFDKIIEDHKQKKKNGDDEEEDLMDVLLRLQDTPGFKCPITTTNIKAVLVDLFTAGTDTSATTVEWTMSELMKNPRVMKKVQSEIRQAAKGKTTINEDDIKDFPYLRSVIKETFRLHPPVPLLLPRECKEDCVVAGYRIPKKTKMMVNGYAIGRDPETWQDPDQFIPERFDGSEIDFKGMHFELIPFGAGRRICPGITFGMANVDLPLAKLLFHFNWGLPNGETADSFDMSENFAVTVGRKFPLNLVPTEYVDSDDAQVLQSSVAAVVN